MTYFISRAGVDSTLRFITEQSAPGSQIVFDYMLEDVVQGMDYSAYGARRTVFFVALRGEPYVFGIAPRQLEAFINLRGLALLSDLGPDDLTQRYLIHSDGTVSGKIAEFVRIVHAEVPEAGERQRLFEQAGIQMKRFGSEKRSDSATHSVDIPDDVQTVLNEYSDAFLRRDYDALLEFFSKKFQSRGFTREQAVAFIRSSHRDRPIHQYKIILTRFDRKGNKARVDGYIQLKGSTWYGTIHEQSLAIVQNNSIYLLTGCSHPGIVQIVERTKKYHPNKRIDLIIGGFHLMRQSNQQVKKLSSNLRSSQVKKLAPSHCTGEQAKRVFKEEWQGNFIDFNIGNSMKI